MKQLLMILAFGLGISACTTNKVEKTAQGNDLNKTGLLSALGGKEARIEGAEAEFSGTIDRDAIRTAIQKNRMKFKACYDSAQKRNKDLYGKIDIQWDINNKGTATNALIRSNSTNDGKLAECIKDTISTIVFPSAPGDQIARVIYPFVFAAK